MTLLIPSFMNCKATLSINASTPISACASGSGSSSSKDDVPFSLYNLPLGVHQVLWDSGPIPDGEQVVFWGVQGERRSPNGAANVTVDDTFADSAGEGSKVALAVSWEYGGYWKEVVDEDDASGAFNKTLAVTDKEGASVVFSAKGGQIGTLSCVGEC